MYVYFYANIVFVTVVYVGHSVHFCNCVASEQLFIYSINSYFSLKCVMLPSLLELRNKPFLEMLG